MNEAETKAFEEWRHSKGGILGTHGAEFGPVIIGAREAWGQLSSEIAVRDSIIKAQNVEIQKMKDQIEHLLTLLKESNMTNADVEMLEHILLGEVNSCFHTSGEPT